MITEARGHYEAEWLDRKKAFEAKIDLALKAIKQAMEIIEEEDSTTVTAEPDTIITRVASMFEDNPSIQLQVSPFPTHPTTRAHTRTHAHTHMHTHMRTHMRKLY